jgi:long-chain-alcohol oxidase
VVLVNVVLWILSTKVGTLALCGRLCISGKFPYVRKFADMPVERREQALTRWNKAQWWFPLKITFVVIKILSHYAFYTTVCSQLAWSHAFSALYIVLEKVCI